MSCYDSEQIKKWQNAIKKGIRFHEWFEKLQEFLEKEHEKLTETAAFKLNEIIQFVEQYSLTDSEEISFIEKDKGMAGSRKRAILKEYADSLVEEEKDSPERSSSLIFDYEFTTPDGSFVEQGTPSPLISPRITKIS